MEEKVIGIDTESYHSDYLNYKGSVNMIVKLKEFGTSLGSRVLGKEVSNMIDFEKEDE